MTIAIYNEIEPYMDLTDTCIGGEIVKTDRSNVPYLVNGYWRKSQGHFSFWVRAEQIEQHDPKRTNSAEFIAAALGELVKSWETDIAKVRTTLKRMGIDI